MGVADQLLIHRLAINRHDEHPAMSGWSEGQREQRRRADRRLPEYHRAHKICRPPHETRHTPEMVNVE